MIIISTVRSGAEHLKSDESFNLGFVKNPKRLNVAVTRAKALLVIVGNPYVLQRDVCWRKMLQFCVDNGAYTGGLGGTYSSIFNYYYLLLLPLLLLHIHYT